MTTVEMIDKLQEQTLENIAIGQKAVLDAVGAWSQAAARSGAQVPAPPAVEGAPTFEQAIESGFDFTQKLIESQREFARSLFKAAAPATRPATRPATPAKKA